MNGIAHAPQKSRKKLRTRVPFNDGYSTCEDCGVSASSIEIVRTLMLGAALIFVWGLQRLSPHTTVNTNWRTNIGLWLIDVVLTRAICGACGIAIAIWGEQLGSGVLRCFAVAPWFGVVLGVVALDGVAWLWHRANHRLAWLWRFHSIHHTDLAFQVTTALRFHPGELLLALPVRLFAIAFLGVPPLGVVVFEIVFGTMNLFVHGNIKLGRASESALARLFITPALHRLHHARDTSDLNSNFGTVFSLFDRLAGTLRASDSRRVFATGLPDSGEVVDLRLTQALAAPFRTAIR